MRGNEGNKTGKEREKMGLASIDVGDRLFHIAF